jgi:lactoylglutathione lyase
MGFTLAHVNINVKNLEESLAFDQKALGLSEVRRVEAEEFTLVFLSDGKTPFVIELTWLRGHTDPYDLGENETHIAFRAEDYQAAHALHQEMGCICFENKGMGIYFIEDPDGYWLEILPEG